MDTYGSSFPEKLAGQALPPLASYPIRMRAPVGTLAPLGSLAARAFSARPRPVEARPRPGRRAEGAGGGGEPAADPGKKRTWLLRHWAAALQGALGASEHHGELQPRAAAAARGRGALARAASVWARALGGGRRRPGSPWRPAGAAGPGDRDGAHPAGGRSGPSGRSIGLAFSSTLVLLQAGMEPRQPRV